MERLRAVAHPQAVAERAQASAGEPITRGEAHVLGFEPLPDLTHALAILGKGLVVASAALAHPRVGGAVDVVDRSTDRRQAARDERLAEAFGRDRQVRQDAEAAEALAEDAPPVDVERGAEELGVADDRVGAEVREVVGLLRRSHPVERADRGRAACPALVEQEHAELGERTRQEARDTGCRARSFMARAALEEHEERPVEPVGCRHLTRKHRDPLAVGTCMVERHRELVLGGNEPRNPVGRRHAAILPQTAPLSRTRRRPASAPAPRRRAQSSAPAREARTRSAARRRRRRRRRS